MNGRERFEFYREVKAQLHGAASAVPTKLPPGTLQYDPARVLDPVFTAVMPFYFAVMDAIDAQFHRVVGVTMGWAAQALAQLDGAR
ncbi:MAG TPA: hypothetical protein VFV36_05350 [Candidatus Methylomirabilis sp.]|nr:hypothetical protein [Candidatus Methylomirabilis sp.]